MKIHLPDCGSVDTMASDNKSYYVGSIDDLLSRGYKPCDRCLPDVEVGSSSEEKEDVKSDLAEQYVLNTNTKKFHYPTCKSAEKIKDENRAEYTGSRDDLLAQDYSPCGNCKP